MTKTDEQDQWRSQEFDWGGYMFLTSHCNFKTCDCANVPHVNKTVTDFFGGYIYRYTLRRYAHEQDLCNTKNDRNYMMHDVLYRRRRFINNLLTCLLSHEESQ